MRRDSRSLDRSIPLDSGDTTDRADPPDDARPPAMSYVDGRTGRLPRPLRVARKARATRTTRLAGHRPERRLTPRCARPRQLRPERRHISGTGPRKALEVRRVGSL